jgi:hypothetical protein
MEDQKYYYKTFIFNIYKLEATKYLLGHKTKWATACWLEKHILAGYDKHDMQTLEMCVCDLICKLYIISVVMWKGRA